MRVELLRLEHTGHSGLFVVIEVLEHLHSTHEVVVLCGLRRSLADQHVTEGISVQCPDFGFLHRCARGRSRSVVEQRKLAEDRSLLAGRDFISLTRRASNEDIELPRTYDVEIIALLPLRDEGFPARNDLWKEGIEDLREALIVQVAD